jgi:transcriptional regulator with XRE-family HTH domain
VTSPPGPAQSSSAAEVLTDLRARLRAIRGAAGLSQTALARSAGWHPSKASKIESGRQVPSDEDIRTWCITCHDPASVTDLLADLHTARGLFVEWRRLEHAGLRRAQQAADQIWNTTRRFRAYNPWMIPGILQTHPYTRAALATIARIRGHDVDIDDAVEIRMDRQRLLRTPGRSFTVVIEECVLHHQLGDSDTMTGQIAHLVTVTSMPTVRLGIIPTQGARTRWPVEGFWIFDSTAVNVELVSGWLTITRPTELAHYEQAHTELAAMARFGPDARALLMHALDASASSSPGRRSDRH